jgi:hypothetical protein
MHEHAPPLYQPLLAENLHRSSASPPGAGALQLGGCSSLIDASLGNVTLCEDAVWLNDALVAQRSSSLDAIFASPPIPAIVPGGRSRHVLTAHYFGGNAELPCAASPQHNYAIRAHAYCDDPIDFPSHCLAEFPGPQLTGVAPAPLSLPSAPARSPPPIAYVAPPGIETPDLAEAACQIELFVAIPSLCSHTLLGPSAAAADHLERLFALSYASPADGFCTSADTAGGDASRADIAGGSGLRGGPRALTYGEVSPHGMLQMLGTGPGRPGLMLGLDQPDSIFLDIGSGVGRLVLATALLTRARAIGVEVVASRHNTAVGALARAEASGAVSREQASRVLLLHGDATAGLPDTTHAYLSNLCFPPDLERVIGMALISLPSLRCAVTLRSLPPEVLVASQVGSDKANMGPDERAGGCKLELVGGVTLAMTWTSAFPALLYCCAQTLPV